MEIKIIAADETYSLRHLVLRPHQTIEDCHYPLDLLEDTIHTGAFLGGQLISIASFFREKSDKFDSAHQYRLRGMATHPEYRRQNAGSSQIRFAETIMKENGTTLWWCNARATVAEYYRKQGLVVIGDVFEVHPIGPHVLMYRKL